MRVVVELSIVELKLVGFDLLLGLDYSVVGSVLMRQSSGSSDCRVLVGKVVYTIK